MKITINMKLDNQKDIFQFTTLKNNIFFTSDTHFGHDNIIKYCSRPFKNSEHMNEEIIKNWNSKVGPNDIVFHLGDFIFGNIENFKSIRERLNGKIYLIMGNHDWKILNQNIIDNEFEGVYQQLRIVIDGQTIYLNHFPFLTFDGIYREKKTWQLFGHVHSNKHNPKSSPDSDRLKYLLPTQYDVGMDNNYYYPISFDEVKTIIENQLSEYSKTNEKE